MICLKFIMGHESLFPTCTIKLVLALATPSLTVRVIFTFAKLGQPAPAKSCMNLLVIFTPETGVMMTSLIKDWSEEVAVTVKVGDGETELLTWKAILVLEPYTK